MGSHPKRQGPLDRPAVRPVHGEGGVRETRYFIPMAGGWFGFPSHRSRGLGMETMVWVPGLCLGGDSGVFAAASEADGVGRGGTHPVELAEAGNGRFYGGKFPMFPGRGWTMGCLT